VWYTVENRNASWVFVRRLKGKRPLGRPRDRGQDIKIDLTGI
jgi:hypothetical protein